MHAQVGNDNNNCDHLLWRHKLKVRWDINVSTKRRINWNIFDQQQDWGRKEEESAFIFFWIARIHQSWKGRLTPKIPFDKAKSFHVGTSRRSSRQRYISGREFVVVPKSVGPSVVARERERASSRSPFIFLPGTSSRKLFMMKLFTN